MGAYHQRHVTFDVKAPPIRGPITDAMPKRAPNSPWIFGRCSNGIVWTMHTICWTRSAKLFSPSVIERATHSSCKDTSGTNTGNGSPDDESHRIRSRSAESGGGFENQDGIQEDSFHRKESVEFAEE